MLTLVPAEIILNGDMVDTSVSLYLDMQGVSNCVLPHAEPVFTVELHAAQRGHVLEYIVNSILLHERRRHRFVMACVTGRDRLDPQAMRAHLSGEWKMFSFATTEDIKAVSGYTKGSVVPLDLTEDVPTVFNNAISKCVNVNICSGDPMAGLAMDSGDLIR